MITFFEITAFSTFFIVLYTYIGYPFLLIFLRCVLPEKKVNKKDIFPEVSLLISCFNEEEVIREKLENALALDYPKNKLEIVVISDASTDMTDEIVREFEKQGVRLIRQDKNLGKTSGLNLAVPRTKGEIIVFSDANALYRTDAIQKLVRNFNDDKVGYVVGEARYKEINQTASDKSETAYWNIEIFLKKMESYIHSVVGGDGAIYAIRKKLYEKMLSVDINDFVNPLQIILKSYRGIFEEEAICWEDAAGEFKKEFKRKVRIVNRSFSGLLRMKAVLSPFKTGFFSLEIISHKVLRWFAPVFISIYIVSCLILSMLDVTTFQLNTLILIIFFWMVYIGYLFSNYSIWLVFYYPYYFVLVNIASIIGLIRSVRGEIQVTWSSVRTADIDEKKSSYLINVVIHLLFFSSIWLFLTVLEKLLNTPLIADKIIYWTAIILLFYVYCGYPVVQKILSKYNGKPIQKKIMIPEVTLLVCAYNEEDVIEEKIKNSCKLDYPPEKLKIVIASDGSTDRTNDIIRQYKDERLILMNYPERRGKIGVIKETVPKLGSEIVIFSDANTMYRKDAVRKLVRNFGDPTVGAVSGDVILQNEETVFGKPESLFYFYERWIQKQESASGSIIGVDGGMYAIRKDLFVPPSSNIILDDFIISMNIACKGYRIVFDEEAVGYERNTNSYKTEFLRKSRIIAGAVQSIIQKEGLPSIKHKELLFGYISHKFLRWMVPVILIILFFINLRLLILSGELIYFITIFTQILFYLIAVSALFLINRIKIQLTLIPFYFCLVNSAALYGIYKGLFNKQPVKWDVFRRKTAAL